MSNLSEYIKRPGRLACCAILMLTGCQLSTSNSKEEVTQPDLTERLVPNALEAAYSRALRLAEQGDPATLSLCDSLLANSGSAGGAEPYYYKGIYFETIKEPVKAIGWFDKTIQTDYNFYESYIEKAALLLELKQFEPALKELELLRTLSPGYAPVHYWLGKWADRLGKKEKALEHFRLALSLDTSLTEARAALQRLEK